MSSDALTPDHVRWAYRLLLDREAESEAVISQKLAGSTDTRQLRRHIMTSGEFKDKNRDYAHSNARVVVIKELGEEGPRLFVDLSDHEIGLRIIRDDYEPDAIALVKRLLRPGDVAVDVGAHVGYFTVHMATAVGEHGHVYAFEPFPPNADLLRRSIKENGYETRVSLRGSAAGARSERARLAFARETLNTGGAYLLSATHSSTDGHDTLPIDVVALDDLPLRRPVRFIKMDCEGAEPQVLAGARTLVVEDRPTILTELHPAQLERVSQTTPAAFLQAVRAMGYEARMLADGRPGPFLTEPITDVTIAVLQPSGVPAYLGSPIP
jgi:FkbM family methyltransferase